MAQIEPRTMPLSTLIREVRTGRLRVPRFQRGLVWRPDQVLELLESVRLRYPIGTLFVWRTPERYSSFDRVGVIPMPNDSPAKGVDVGYLLDGHQRVSTLVGTLGLTDAEASQLKGADRIFLVWYDLKQKKFVHSRRPEPHQLPVRYLLPVSSLDVADPLVDWCEQHRESTKHGSPERTEWDRYIRDAQQLRTIFASAHIRFDDVTGAALQEAIDIFKLVNRQGTPVKPQEVFAALSWDTTFDFPQRARECVEGVEGFDELDSTPILRALMRSLGRSAYEQDWETSLKENRESLPGHMEALAAALQGAVTFLDRQFHARHARVVPYTLQIVLLMRFFQLQPQPTAPQTERLKRWFWASSFGGLYGGVGALPLDEHITRAERLAKGEDLDILDQRPMLQPLPLTFHPRSARVRAWHLFLATLHPLSPDNGEPVPRPLGQGLPDVRTLFPGDKLRSMTLGSRLLVGRLGGAPLRRLRRAITQPWFSRLLESHGVPRPAWDELESDNLDRFIELRHEHIAGLERTFALQFTQAPTGPEADEVYVEPVIDIEEDIPDGL